MNTAQCRSCGAVIVWLKTSRGKSIPVNAGTAKEGDTNFDAKRHIAHFATCPEADKFRRRKA